MRTKSIYEIEKASLYYLGTKLISAGQIKIKNIYFKEQSRLTHTIPYPKNIDFVI